MANYADVEDLLVDWLKAKGWVNVVTEEPGNLHLVMPLLVVNRYGGGDDMIAIDKANVDIDCYASTAVTAKAGIETVRRQVRTQLSGHAASGAVVARVETISGPTRLPYDSRSQVRRFGISIRLTLHQYSGV